jgi:hypothetical protein
MYHDLLKSHAQAARHGDAFFWSFAQKMVPRSCGFEVIFRIKEERFAKNRFKLFGQPMKPLHLDRRPGSTRKRTLPLAAVSGV